MRRVGVVQRIKGTYCFIREQGITDDRWAHLRDFRNPEDFRVGNYVKFTLVPMPNPPINHPVTDVEALLKAAA